MTVTAETFVPKTYAGDGITTIFPTTFLFYDETDIPVILETSAGFETQVLGTDYTVTLGTETSQVKTGSVVMNIAPAEGERLWLGRLTPQTQTAQYFTNRSLTGKAKTAVPDKLTLTVQELKEQADRSIQLSWLDDSGADTVLPTPLAGGVLAWDSEGTAITNIVFSVPQSSIVIYDVVTASSTVSDQGLYHVSYTTSGAVTVTIASDFIAENGNFFTVKDGGRNAGTNNITITTEGSETIEGEASFLIKKNGETVDCYTLGGNVFIK